MNTTISEVMDWAGTDVWHASPFGLLLYAVVVIAGYRRVAK